VSVEYSGLSNGGYPGGLNLNSAYGRLSRSEYTRGVIVKSSMYSGLSNVGYAAGVIVNAVYSGLSTGGYGGGVNDPCIAHRCNLSFLLSAPQPYTSAMCNTGRNNAQ
jgi:hypothetical protein